MGKKYEEQSRSRAVSVTTGSILAVMVAMGLYVLADFGAQEVQGNVASIATATQPVA